MIFLSITLITGMGGQLSLCQATLAGVGAFTAAQLANHLGLSLLLGGLVGALAAGAVAVVLAVASLRLRGLGLALMTIAAALFFDNAVFPRSPPATAHAAERAAEVGRPRTSSTPTATPSSCWPWSSWSIVILGVLLIRKGTTGRYLAAMRGSETAAAGLGINLTWQRVLIFALSGVVAGIGGTLFTIQQQSVTSAEFNYQLSLAFVVIVVTTGVSTVEGAINAGFGFVVIQQLLTYLPARFGGNSLVFVLFAFGAFTYASHPEGILEFQKRRWTLRMERLVFHTGQPPPACRRPSAPRSLRRGGGSGPGDGGRPGSDPGRVRAGGERPWLMPMPSCGSTGSPRCSAASPPSTTSVSTWRPARASDWWGPTAPARRRCSTASAANSSPSGAASSWPARSCSASPPTSGPASASAGPTNESRSFPT